MVGHHNTAANLIEDPVGRAFDACGSVPSLAASVGRGGNWRKDTCSINQIVPSEARGAKSVSIVCRAQRRDFLADSIRVNKPPRRALIAGERVPVPNMASLLRRSQVVGV